MLRRGCGTLQPDGRYYGSGVTETDRSLSAKYFEEAAKSGDPLAIGNLAFFHLDGKVHTHLTRAHAHKRARARAYAGTRRLPGVRLTRECGRAMPTSSPGHARVCAGTHAWTECSAEHP